MNLAMKSALLLILAAGSAAAAPTTVVEGTGGPMLTNADGMTLYTFDKDAEGVSNCVDECAALWPVFAADEDDQAEGDYAMIERDDGTRQWTYKGMPLYTFAKDAAAGDATGDGVKDVWHIARP